MSRRRTTAARKKAKIMEISRAEIKAAIPGNRLTNLVKKRAVDCINACFTCSHINTSIAARSELRVEAIGPAPSRKQIRLAGFVSDGQSFKSLVESRSFGGVHFTGVRRDPAQIQRRHGLEQMLATHCPKA